MTVNRKDIGREAAGDSDGGHRGRNSLAYMVGLGLTAKFFVDISVQLFQPFLTIIAAGMGIGVVTMGRLVSVKNLMGLSAPLLGNLADRFGYRTVMRAGLLLSGAGFLLLGSGSGLILIIAGMVLSGIGQAGYTPTIQAYLSAKLSYEKRSRYLGILEYSWALAGIIGLFFIGHLMDWYNWRLPLFILAGGFFGMSLIFATLPEAQESEGRGRDERAGESRNGAMGRLKNIKAFFDLGEHRGSAWGAVAVNFFNFLAISHLMIIHGGWLEMEYGLTAGQLGNVAFLMGFADWGASILVSIYGDRIGKRRGVLLGVGGMSLFFLILPFLDVSLPLALAAIALPRFCFEFATVSNFPLLSEQLPSQRGKIMALSFSAGLSGTVITGLTGPAFYLRWGVWGLGPFSLLFSLVSLLLLTLFVRERPYGDKGE